MKAHQLTSAGAESEEEAPVLRLVGGHAALIKVDVTVIDILVTIELDTEAVIFHHVAAAAAGDITRYWGQEYKLSFVIV